MEEAQIRFSVPLSQKNAFAMIAALRDVVRNVREYDPVLSRHGWKVAGTPRRWLRVWCGKMSKMKGCVPFANMKGRVPSITANGVTFARGAIP